MKILNQFKYKLLPVLLVVCILSPFFSFDVLAEDSDTLVYCDGVIDETENMVYDLDYTYVIYGTNYTKKVDFVYPGWDGCRYCFYLGSQSNTLSGYVLRSYGSTTYSCDVITVNNSNGSSSVSSGQSLLNNQPALYTYKPNNLSSHETSSFETNIPIFASEAEALAFQTDPTRIVNAVNYMKVYDCETESWVPVVVEEPEGDKADKDYIFNIFDSFQDFTQQSHEFNDAAHKQTITENENNPNDGVFQSLLVSLADLQHTGNSIMQQISNQIQNFSENFFDNFAQYSLGLLTDIKDGISSLVDAVIPDNLEAVIDAVYSSGLDADGNFGLGTFFDFWFIPEEDYFGTIFNQLSSDRTGFFQVFDIMDYMKSGLLNLEPTAPVIIIPGGTYGFLTIPDIELGFAWFEAWKPFTDPLIAAFLYVTYVWHLILQIPGILSGSAGTVASGNHYESNEIRRENNERLRGK